jgi:ribosomal protein S18 acetylase RimI-like enzyme
LVRITPYTQPPSLDAHLAELGFESQDHTVVMVCGDIASALAQSKHLLLPPALRLQAVPPYDYVATVGRWRGTPEAGIQAHAERVRTAPIQQQALTCIDAAGQALAGGQAAREGSLVGLYDVFTAPEARGRGLARAVCMALLAQAQAEGAVSAYLQVEADNPAARRLYRRLCFEDAYVYHYRVRPA